MSPKRSRLRPATAPGVTSPGQAPRPPAGVFSSVRSRTPDRWIASVTRGPIWRGIAALCRGPPARGSYIAVDTPPPVAGNRLPAPGQAAQMNRSVSRYAARSCCGGSVPERLRQRSRRVTCQPRSRSPRTAMPDSPTSTCVVPDSGSHPAQAGRTTTCHHRAVVRGGWGTRFPAATTFRWPVCAHAGELRRGRGNLSFLPCGYILRTCATWHWPVACRSRRSRLFRGGSGQRGSPRLWQRRLPAIVGRPVEHSSWISVLWHRSDRL